VDTLSPVFFLLASSAIGKNVEMTALIQDLSVREQQEWFHLYHFFVQVLKEEVAQEEIQEEHKHYLEVFSTAASTTSVIPSTSSEDERPLFLKEWRIKIGGKSWFPPDLFTLFYILSLQPIQPHWKQIVPRTVLRTIILEPLPLASLWPRLILHLPQSPFALDEDIQHFSEALYQVKNHPSAFPQFLTIFLPNWDELWTLCAWPIRRRLGRLISTYQQSRPLRRETLHRFIQLGMQNMNSF